MKTFGLFLIISMLTRNPLLALLIIVLIYVFIDRSFIGILPDFAAPLRRRQRMARLLREIQANPHNANAWMELGELYFLQGQYRRAVEYLQKALVKMDDSALVRFYLGASYYHLGQKEQSRAELAEAVKLNPRVAHGYPYLYLLKHGPARDDNRTEELIEDIFRYGSVNTFFAAAKYFKQVGRPRRAARFFSEVLDIYRLSSPTMRRRYRKMALYAWLFGGRK